MSSLTISSNTDLIGSSLSILLKFILDANLGKPSSTNSVPPLPVVLVVVPLVAPEISSAFFIVSALGDLTSGSSLVTLGSVSPNFTLVLLKALSPIGLAISIVSSIDANVASDGDLSLIISSILFLSISGFLLLNALAAPKTTSNAVPKPAPSNAILTLLCAVVSLGSASK